MARPIEGSPPTYRRHRASGQAVVTLAGRDFYLGKFGTAASKTEYSRLIAEFAVTGVAPVLCQDQAAELTVTELILLYWKHCRRYYVKNGEPTSEQGLIRYVMRDIKRLYGKRPASEFGPLALKAIRQEWIDRGHARKSINANAWRVTRMFRWAVAEELVPASVHQSLKCVQGLAAGRTEAKELDPVKPIGLDVVESTIPHLLPVVADMVRLQLLAGMRPSEVCNLRPRDVDRSSDVWEYTVGGHKTEHRGRTRTVYLGPEAQAVLSPYLFRDDDHFCFSPAEAVEQLRAFKGEHRQTPRSCGNRAGTNRKRSPRRTPGARYDKNSYRRAIHRACDRAFPSPEPLGLRADECNAARARRLTARQRDELGEWQSSHRWNPNQLRHTKGTEIRKRFGLEAAQVILGHAAADVTQIYAERDADKAREVARRIG